MKKTIYRYFFHFICYYTVWFSTIFLARNAHPWGGPIVVFIITCIQFIVLRSGYQENKILYFTLILVAIGFCIDSIFIVSQQIDFVSNPLKPFSSPWMIGIWINFSIIFYDSCHQYFKHYIILGLLALFGFPAAYYTGIILKAATLPNGLLPLIYFGLIWSILLPTICYQFRKREQ